MQKTIRQSMAWLHSWLGLSFGWLLFAIFLMGSVSYYRHEISLWMQPQFVRMQIQQDTAIQSSFYYLQTHATDAKSWHINIASPEHPVNQIYWQKADDSFESKILDANTGEELTLSATQGGEFFYNFHFQLFGLPIMIGRLITTIAALIMLITLISGIITHKKILTDFFTLRAFKGPRSYLDFHNVSSVIALPFFLVMTFTGLAIFFYILLPNGLKKLYPDNPFQYFDEIRNVVVINKTPPQTASMLPISYFTQQAEQRWGKTSLDNITIKNPNTNQAQLTLTELEDHSITRNQAQLSFNAHQGNILQDTRNHSAVATLNASMYGLHMATFAQPLLRLGLFFSGLLGCAMIGSGLLLWSLKRQLQRKQSSFHFGHYLVNRLNIAILLGLPVAMLSYLYANRLIQIPNGSPNYEIYSFFTVWGLSFIIALCTPQRWLWKSQLKVLIIIGISLPILNLYQLLTHQHIQNVSDYWKFLRVDLFILAVVIFAIFLHQHLEPIRQKSTEKMRQKLQKTTQKQESPSC